MMTPKQQARHMALQDLAKIVMPMLMEDIPMHGSTPSEKKSKAKKDREDDQDDLPRKNVEAKKPIATMSITKILAAMPRSVAKEVESKTPPKGKDSKK